MKKLKHSQNQSSQQTTLTSFFKTKSPKKICNDLCNQNYGSSVDSGIGISSNEADRKKSSKRNGSSPNKKNSALKTSPIKSQKNKSPKKLTNFRTIGHTSRPLQPVVIELSDEESSSEPVLRRSPRKHSVISNPKRNVSHLSNQNKSPPVLLDETDNCYFLNLKSPVKLDDGASKKRSRDGSELSPRGVSKVARSLKMNSPLKRDDLLNCECPVELMHSDPHQESHQNYTSKVDLSEGLRCQVTSVAPTTDGDISLKLTCLQTGDIVCCTLLHPWNALTISVGDVVSVKAKKNNDTDGWIVSQDGTWFVLHSDVLISCTAVVGSLFCQRRSVIGDLFKEAPGGTQAFSMFIGIVVHQLLQQALKSGVKSAKQLEKLYEEVIGSQELLRTAYLQDMDVRQIREATSIYLPRILQFVSDYMSPSSSSVSKPSSDRKITWPGEITAVTDIEENVWVPRFGLKGKIDVTVQVKTHSSNKVMPLELKTGKASGSAEHYGQVILYCMMLSHLKQTSVDSGLLLYLKECCLKEVKGGDVERRDLILLRNQLASRIREASESSRQRGVPSLPPPIDRKRACETCPQLIPCTAVLRMSGDKTHPLSALAPDTTSHLSDRHLQYIFHWLKLLTLESKEAKQLSPIWAGTIGDREKEGRCVSGLEILGTVESKQLKAAVILTRSLPIKQGVLEVGQYVVVSTDKQIAISCGHVQALTTQTVSLLLDRDIGKLEGPFHIDHYGSSGSFNLSSYLSFLLDNSAKAHSLRRIIIDLELPKFASKLSSKIKAKCHQVFMSINRDQVRALLQVLSADSFIIVKGMPGTGKSRTVVALVEVLTVLGHSVLLTSHTHSAVDNILMRLPGRLHDRVLRLGSSSRIHPRLAHLTETALLADPTLGVGESLDRLTSFYQSKTIVGVTCLGASHPLLTKRRFDYCIVDEATQVCQPETLAALNASDKFVLIGDPLQLPPLVISETSKDLGMAVSLLERLDRPAVTTSLTVQYRMNRVVTALANAFSYGNELQCADEEVANSTIAPSQNGSSDMPIWLVRICSGELSDSVLVVDISMEDQANHNVNEKEAETVLSILSSLKTVGIREEDIGVMSPYRAQVSLLESLIKGSCTAVEVSTVDQYQGRDKSVILYSATRNKPMAVPRRIVKLFTWDTFLSDAPLEMMAGQNDILGDKRRLTVAITRAKHKLVIIGNVKSLSSFTTFRALFSHLDSDKFLETDS